MYMISLAEAILKIYKSAGNVVYGVKNWRR